MKVHYPKLYNMAHLLALNVLLLPKDLTIISIYYIYQYLYQFSLAGSDERLTSNQMVNQ